MPKCPPKPLKLQKLIERMYAALYEMDENEGKDLRRVLQCSRRAEKYLFKMDKYYPDAKLGVLDLDEEDSAFESLKK